MLQLLMNFLGGLLRITVPIGPLDTIDNLASVHSYFYNRDYQDSQSKIIDNISNTLTDRCVANHAAILLVSESWDKTLNKLNCHLHPLDSIALKTRSASKECEDTLALKKKQWGNNCSAGNIVIAMNTLRYKDGKGDLCGFVTFLDNQKLPRGEIGFTFFSTSVESSFSIKLFSLSFWRKEHHVAVCKQACSPTSGQPQAFRCRFWAFWENY